MTNTFLENNFFKDKKILLTGHTGFKGAWLSLLLHKLGAKVFGYALNPASHPNLFDEVGADAFVTSKIADIRNFGSLKDFVMDVRPTIIVHMAAQSLVRSSYRNPRLTYETNVMGTVNLLEAARVYGKAKVLLNVTTDKCYEDNFGQRGYRENDRLGGHDPYANSKACSELVTASYRSAYFDKENIGGNGTMLATARSGNIIGGGDWSKDRLIPDFVRTMLSQKEMVVRNPNAIRPWQYILDSLFGYLMLVERLYKDGKSYAESWNFGPDEGNDKTVEWIINRLYQNWDQKTAYVLDCGKKVHETNFLRLDSTKAKTRLNWSNKYTLEDGLEKTVAWYRRYVNGEHPRKICASQIDDFLQVETSRTKLSK